MGSACPAERRRPERLEQTRERLRLLHGARASLGVERSPGGGVVATLRLPYRRLRESEPEGST